MTFIKQILPHNTPIFFVMINDNRASEKIGSLSLLIHVVVVGTHGGIAETTIP